MRTEMTGKLALSILLITTFAIPLAAQNTENTELPTVDQILERYIEAVGGREAIEKLTTRVCSLEVTHDLSWTDPKIQMVLIEAWAKVPHLVLWKEHKPAGVRLEGYDGTNFWHSEGGETEIQDDSIPLKFRFVYDPIGPLHIEDYFPDLSLLSIETVGGRECYMLAAKDLKVTYYALYFDIETGLLTNIGYYWEMLDYHEVNGVKIPFKITGSRKGGSSTYIFESIEHNVPLEDELFAVPENQSG